MLKGHVVKWKQRSLTLRRFSPGQQFCLGTFLRKVIITENPCLEDNLDLFFRRENLIIFFSGRRKIARVFVELTRAEDGDGKDECDRRPHDLRSDSRLEVVASADPSFYTGAGARFAVRRRQRFFPLNRDTQKGPRAAKKENERAEVENGSETKKFEQKVSRKIFHP